jgi:hypothetical protein
LDIHHQGENEMGVFQTYIIRERINGSILHYFHSKINLSNHHLILSILPQVYKGRILLKPTLNHSEHGDINNPMFRMNNKM